MNYNIDTKEGMANAVRWMEQTLATPLQNAHLADSQSSRNLHHRQKWQDFYQNWSGRTYRSGTFTHGLYRKGNPMKEIFDKLKHSPIYNYILPGLTSWVLKPAGDGHGMIRMFEASRETQEFITPHSHRYGLHCEVLAGWVENTLWKNSEFLGASANYDEWMLYSLEYGGNPGEYTQTPGPIRRYAKETRRYAAGSSYDLNYSQIHSVRFSRSAVIVITETEQQTDTTQILLPVAYGKAVPTFKVEPWMYKA